MNSFPVMVTLSDEKDRYASGARSGMGGAVTGTGSRSAWHDPVAGVKGRYALSTPSTMRRVPLGPTSTHIMGNLTFNNVTKPVMIEAELSGLGTNGMNQKKTLGFHGTTTIRRSDWNILWGIPYGIGDEVDLTISVAFEK